MVTTLFRIGWGILQGGYENGGQAFLRPHGSHHYTLCDGRLMTPQERVLGAIRDWILRQMSDRFLESQRTQARFFYENTDMRFGDRLGKTYSNRVRATPEAGREDSERQREDEDCGNRRRYHGKFPSEEHP